MPIGKITQDVTPPEKLVVSSEYGSLYMALYEAKPDTWLAINIRHKADTRVPEIARVRRAVQRWFGQEDNRIYKMSSRVEQIDANESVMFIRKETR